MNSVEVVLYFEQPKYDALKAALKGNGSDIETEMKNHFRFLYEQLLPPEQQLSIEADIERMREQERLEAEARKRFAAFHVREHGNDFYFQNEIFTSVSAVGYRYRQYERGELGSKPQTFVDAIARSEEITEALYHVYAAGMPEDPRVLAVMDFDLEAGTLSFMTQNHEEMHSYYLHDVSVAAYKANRGDRSTARTATAFSEALVGKEIEAAPAQEQESALQM